MLCSNFQKGAQLLKFGPANGLLSQIKRIRPDLTRVALVARFEPSAGLEQSLQHLKRQWPNIDHKEESTSLRLATTTASSYLDRYP